MCAEIAGRGVRLLTGPADREWGMRTATFAAPGGHIWEIAQEFLNSRRGRLTRAHSRHRSVDRHIERVRRKTLAARPWFKSGFHVDEEP